MKGFWEERFNALATFNAEKARGIMHTAEYTEKMQAMQQEYDLKLRATTADYESYFGACYKPCPKCGDDPCIGEPPCS